MPFYFDTLVILNFGTFEADLTSLYRLTLTVASRAYLMEPHWYG